MKNTDFNITDSYHKSFSILTGMIWTMVILASLAWNIYSTTTSTNEIAKATVKIVFDRDVLYRRWNSNHGGVYVKMTDTLRPNPNLEKVKAKNIVIQSLSGEKYTLVNPAYMTRQVHEMHARSSDYESHIISLKPLNPVNTPDQWEKAALEKFEKAKQLKEIYNVGDVNGLPYMRYIGKLVTKKSCLKCHQHQGYKINEARGGVSSSVLMTPFYKARNKTIFILVSTHIFVWLLVLLILVFGVKQLELYQMKLMELNNTKDKFFSIIGHDLKTPFASLVGYSTILYNKIDTLDKDKIKNMALKINSTSQRAHKLLENLLAWALAQTGKVDRQPQMIKVSELVNESTDLLNEAASQKGIKLTNNISPNVSVYADHNMIDTVVRNIFSNSIKFTPKGGEIKASATESDTNVEICISDTGIGISEEDIKKIFRIDSTHTTKGTEGEKGTGLGLILCQEFIEMNGGKIWVTSQIGKGSEFWFSLPKKSKQ